MLDFKKGYFGRPTHDASSLGPEQRIAVCGAHRSGTTLLGSLLTADDQSLQLTEPFHPVVGVEGINQWYIAADVPGGKWKGLIDRFLSGEVMTFSSMDGRRPSLWRRVVGTPRSREYAAVRSDPPARLVIKDPFLSLSTQYLVRRHRFQVVFAVKHPAAFLSSLRRVGWDRSVPLDDLVSQGVISAEQRNTAQGPVAEAALLWNAINRHALETKRRFPGSVAVWSHDRFCVEPDSEMQQLTEALGIGYSDTMRQEVARSTLGDVVTPPSETIHQLVRNSAAMVGKWRERLPQSEQDEMRVRCGATYRELVGADW